MNVLQNETIPYGERNICSRCNMEVEFLGEPKIHPTISTLTVGGWTGRGGDRYCDESGAARFDDNGIRVPFPHLPHVVPASEINEPTCAQRLPKELRDRLDDFEKMDQAIRTSGDDESFEAIYEYPLGVSTYTVKRVELSTGGTADWLEYFIDDDKQLTRIVYHFADWFDHAERTLNDDEDEFEIAEAFGQTLGIFE